MGVIDWIFIPSDVVGEYCYAIGLVKTRHRAPFGLVRVGAWKVFTQLKFIFKGRVSQNVFILSLVPLGIIYGGKIVETHLLKNGRFHWPLKNNNK